MTFVHDTRDKIDKHKNVDDYLEGEGHKIVRTKMFVGDITLLNNQSICIDLKKDLLEVCGNVAQQHERFCAELRKAKENEIKLIILVEQKGIGCLDDVREWVNPRLKKSPLAISGERLHKILYSLEKKYGCEFRFCEKKDTGKVIVDLLLGDKARKACV